MTPRAQTTEPKLFPLPQAALAATAALALGALPMLPAHLVFALGTALACAAGLGVAGQLRRGGPGLPRLPYRVEC
jgi:hypothetical protein